MDDAKSKPEPNQAIRRESYEDNSPEEDEVDDSQRVDMDKKSTAPDGGWGWMVVVGAAISHMFVAGASSCYGLIYLYLMERFEGSAAKTATINGISIALRFGCGPIASAASNWLSARVVVIFGGSLVFAGIALCSVPPNLDFMFFTWSILYGIGGCLCLTPSIITVGHYFNKRRSIANGFSTAGSGIGQFSFPLLFEYLVGAYGYYGCMLILAAITWNLIIGGALFRPLLPSSLDVKPKNSENTGEDYSSSNLGMNQKDTPNDDNFECDNLAQECDGCQQVSDVIEVHCVHKKLMSNSAAEEPIKQNNNEHSFKSNRKYLCQCCNFSSRRSCQWKKRILDLTVLTDPSFVMYAVFLTLGTMAYMLVKMFIPALVASRGFSRSFSAQLLAYIGLADMFGRISSGFFFNLSKVRPIRRYLYNFIPVILCLMCALFTVAQTNVQYTILAFCYGFHIGFYVSQMHSILADLVGMERFSSAVGLLMFFRGTGVIVGPAVGGALRDLTGKYDGAYYFAACAGACGTLIFLCQNLIYFRHQRQHRTL